MPDLERWALELCVGRRRYVSKGGGGRAVVQAVGRIGVEWVITGSEKVG